MKRRMTEKEYRAYPAVNKSTLWEIRKSPAHYKYALEHPNPDTPALKMGRAIHMAILQPDDFSKRYMVSQNFDRRTKEGKAQYEAFMASVGDKELIDSDTFNELAAMYEAVWTDPDATEMLTGCRFETPLFWTDEATGIKCKCRLDADKRKRRHAVVVDLKSCTDANTNTFMREALKYGYDVQCAHYLRGYKANYRVDTIDWYFIAVEKKPPYAVNVIKAGDAFIDRGTWQLIDLMDRLKECRDTNTWPGYGRNELVLPEWASIPDDTEE